ncbi:MAG: fused MFS/spermidine synthase [candidate division KSB1 bacterium]|nr:fused MFS/spermidine synthase [candidate division KSB1 bacterium]MDZ7318395.1 fused MFS/spermidine synthase [candidate division KSB1 bacterium]MDZ7340069.1 fused MFS/spermidine synthase [candidate division KSB1 bacterium]
MIDDISYFRRNVVRKIVIFFLWLSGVTTAFTVIAWLRLFKIALGHTILVNQSVVTMLLAGIALSSYLVSRKIDKLRNDIQIFSRSELAIGISSVVLLLALPLLPLLLRAVAAHAAHPDSAFIAIVKIWAIALFILPASFFIGAPLPPLSRFFIQSADRVGSEIGKIYGAKILGAAMGCFLSCFFFMPFLGIRQTLALAAGLNLLTGGLLRFLWKQTEATLRVENDFYDQQLKHLTVTPQPQPSFLLKAVSGSWAICGVIAGGLFVIWTRSLFFLTGSDCYAMHIIATVFLLGLSLGASLFPRMIHVRWNPISILIILFLLIACWGTISIALLPHLAPLQAGNDSAAADVRPWNWQILTYVMNTMVCLLVPSFLMGAIFPLIGRIIISDFDERGLLIGRLYATLAIGLLLGFSGATLFMLGHIGIHKSLVFFILLSLLANLVMLFLVSALHYLPNKKTALLFAATVGVIIITFTIPSSLFLRLFTSDKPTHKLVYLRHGIHSTITAYQNPAATTLDLASNGTILASTATEWLACLRTLGHLPLLLHAQPNSVLTLGFKNGEVLKSILLHPIQRVDCADNADEVMAAVSQLTTIGDILDAEPRYHLIKMDGKEYNTITSQKYDVIINDLLHPSVHGHARFYSRNFFNVCKKNLASGGIMATGLPITRISLEDFRIMLHTFQTVFPNCSLWYVNNAVTPYALLIGRASGDFQLNFRQLDERLKDQLLPTNLNRIGLDNIYEILDCFVMGPKVIAQLTKEVRVNTDNFPHLEFSTPRTSDAPANSNQILQLLASYRESIYPYLINIHPQYSEREFTKAIIENYYQSTEQVFVALSFELFGETDKALKVYRQVIQRNRFDRGAQRFLDSYYDPQLISTPHTPAELVENAKVYYQKMEYEEAIHALNQALAQKPDYAPAFFALGINYEILGEWDMARRMYQKTLSLIPDLPQARERLDSLAVKIKKYQTQFQPPAKTN